MARPRTPGSRALLTPTVALLVIAGGLGLIAPLGAAASFSANPSVVAPQLGVTNFHFAPNQISQGSSTQGSFGISGGTPPFFIWVNNSAPGCAPPSNPFQTSNLTTSFTCTPSGTGTFTVHLDVLDSATPTGRASATADLIVNPSGSGGGSSGNNSGNNTGFSLPSGLVQMALVFGGIVLASIVAIAAGTIAIAISVSRRLRQINETLAKLQPPEAPKAPK